METDRIITTNADGIEFIKSKFKSVNVIDDQPEPKTFTITNPYPNKQKIIKPSTFVKTNRKVYPNDPCTCGSGKKFKKCCK